MRHELWAITLAATLGAASASAQTAPSASENQQAAQLATTFNVPADRIQALRDTGMGWGDIRNALSVSQAAGADLDTVLAMRNEGRGWGQIVQHFGLDPNTVLGTGAAPAGSSNSMRTPGSGTTGSGSAPPAPGGAPGSMTTPGATPTPGTPGTQSPGAPGTPVPGSPGVPGSSQPGLGPNTPGGTTTPPAPAGPTPGTQQ